MCVCACACACACVGVFAAATTLLSPASTPTLTLVSSWGGKLLAITGIVACAPTLVVAYNYYTSGLAPAVARTLSLLPINVVVMALVPPTSGKVLAALCAGAAIKAMTGAGSRRKEGQRYL